MYTVFESGVEGYRSFGQTMDQYDLEVLEKTRINALEHYGRGMVRRARIEFELLKELADAAKSPKTLEYKQAAEKGMAACNAKIREFDEQNAARRPRARRRI